MTHRDRQNKGQAGREEITNEKGRRQSEKKSKIRRKKEQRERDEVRKTDTEMDEDCKILIVAGGKLMRPTMFHFCVQRSIDPSKIK